MGSTAMPPVDDASTFAVVRDVSARHTANAAMQATRATARAISQRFAVGALRPFAGSVSIAASATVACDSADSSFAGAAIPAAGSTTPTCVSAIHRYPYFGIVRMQR